MYYSSASTNQYGYLATLMQIVKTLKENKQTFTLFWNFYVKNFLYEYNRMGESDGDNLAIILSVIEGNKSELKSEIIL